MAKIKFKEVCCDCVKFRMFGKTKQLSDFCRLKNKKVDPLGKACENYRFDRRQKIIYGD